MGPSLSSRRRAILLGSDSGRSAVHRIQVAVAALAAVTVFGTLGYVVLGFGWLEALYQTVTTVATVGFREVRPLGPAGMAFTLVLILVGVGTVLYNLGVILEALTEGHLREHLWRRRMDRTIAQMSDHVIICGFGRVGRAAAQHLVDGGQDIVVVDVDPARVSGASVGHLVGDASDEATLREAGIERARALICALDTDADTVYATLCARALRPDLVIIARARTEASSARLVQAGATRAYNPQVNGGRRMAIFALHADVAEFLDQVMRSDDLAYNIAQVRVGPRSALAGRTLGEADVAGRTGAQLLAVRRPAKGHFVPNPPADLPLEPGMTLIVFADVEQEARVRALESGESRVPPSRPAVASPVPEPGLGPLSQPVAEPRHP